MVRLQEAYSAVPSDFRMSVRCHGDLITTPSVVKSSAPAAAMPNYVVARVD